MIVEIYRQGKIASRAKRANSKQGAAESNSLQSNFYRCGMWADRNLSAITSFLLPMRHSLNVGDALNERGCFSYKIQCFCCETLIEKEGMPSYFGLNRLHWPQSRLLIRLHRVKELLRVA